MRTKPAILAFFALATIAMQGLFTSCAGDENLSTEKPSTGTQTLKINLKSADTRAAVYADPGTLLENTINSVTIGIFDKTTSAVKTIQDAPDPAAPEITTSQLTEGDHILVAVNAKAGTFTGVLTESDFEKKTLGIDDALGGGDPSATTVANTKLPMFGTGSIAHKSGSTTAYEAIVPVYHMVAKVTLQSLKVDFDATGAYQKATFTPTEVFLLNVPDALDFYPATDMSSYSTFATYTNLCQGQTGGSNLKDYLGTGTVLTAFTAKNTTLSGVAADATSSWGSTTAGSKILFLYTMPNTSANPTQLVIKGQFAADGASAVPVYYPVNINYNYNAGTPTAVDGGILKQVYPNKNYVIDVTIKGKGADSPTKSLDPQTVTAHITVNPFVDATQSNTFN